MSNTETTRDRQSVDFILIRIHHSAFRFESRQTTVRKKTKLIHTKIILIIIIINLYIVITKKLLSHVSQR